MSTMSRRTAQWTWPPSIDKVWPGLARAGLEIVRRSAHREEFHLLILAYAGSTQWFLLRYGSSQLSHLYISSTGPPEQHAFLLASFCPPGAATCFRLGIRGHCSHETMTAPVIDLSCADRSFRWVAGWK